MTWQRIDENTYIDDTLVTCAEYQLFIDEMREQGKCHQPDHWTSYQFPEGQAREPILGVRHSDAIAFGYWIDQEYQFAWVETASKDARGLADNLAFTKDYFYFAKDTAEARNLTLALDLARARNLTIALDLARIDYLADTIAQTHDLKWGLDLARDLACDYAREIASAIDHIDLGDAIYYACNLARNRYIAHDISIEHDLDLAYDFAFDICIDIITLQERIARRSPAFEGIRLVKERIR